jgi:hypothetical protein
MRAGVFGMNLARAGPMHTARLIGRRLEPARPLTCHSHYCYYSLHSPRPGPSAARMNECGGRRRQRTAALPLSRGRPTKAAREIFIYKYIEIYLCHSLQVVCVRACIERRRRRHGEALLGNWQPRRENNGLVFASGPVCRAAAS